LSKGGFRAMGPWAEKVFARNNSGFQKMSVFIFSKIGFHFSRSRLCVLHYPPLSRARESIHLWAQALGAKQHNLQ